MAKGTEKYGAYAILAGAVGLVLAALVTGISLLAAEPGEFELFSGWALAFFLLSLAGVFVIGWIVIGIFTPLWDVPDLPEGESYFHRLRTLRERRRKRHEAQSAAQFSLVLRIPSILKWNRNVVLLALTEGKVWADREHGPDPAGYPYSTHMRGTPRPAREFFSRCQDVDHVVQRLMKLSRQPGYGERLSKQDEERLSKALETIDAALACADDALAALDTT